MGKRFILSAIILLGTGLRLFVLLQRGSLDFDEAFAIHFAALNLSALWENLRLENNPPGYFVLLHFWLKIFGNTDLAARALSLVFGAAAIPLLCAIGKRVHSREAGLFAAFLLAISTLPVFYSTEARMYALYLFLTLAVMWFYLKLEEYRAKNRSTNRVRIIFFLLCALLVWTHITAWMMFAVIAVYIFWKSRWNLGKCITNHRNFFIILILLALQLLPWLIPFVAEKFGNSLAGGYVFFILPDSNYFLSMLETFLVFGQQNHRVVFLLSVLMGILLWAALALRRSNLRTSGDWISSRRTLLLFWLGVPLLAGFLLSNAVPRYFIAVAPAWYLLLGVGFARLREYTETQSPKLQRLSLGISGLFFALILTAYAPLLQQVTRQGDDLAAWVKGRENEECKMQNVKCVVLVHPHSEVLTFTRYWRGEIPVFGFYPQTDRDSRDLRIVKTNWKNLVTPENVRALADVTDGFNRVFLVLGETDRTNAPELLKQWFWSQGWLLKDHQESGQMSVMLLQGPGPADLPRPD